MNPDKPKQVRIYLDPPDLAYLQTLADECKTRDTAILAVLCAAGIDAVRKNNSRFPMPLRFRISDVPDAPPVPNRIRNLTPLKK